jgi:hypothetical protein
MKTIFIRIFSVIFLLSMFVTPATEAAKAGPAGASSPTPVDMTVIGGWVTGISAPVRVQAFNPAGELVAETYTGPQGQFKFKPLAKGEYHLQVVDEQGHRLEMRQEAQVDPLANGGVERVEVRLSPAFPPVEAETTAATPIPADEEDQGMIQAAGTGQISGTVTAASGGALLSSVWVTAYTSRTASEYAYVAYDYTDATGTYSLTGLADGTYYVRYEKTDYLTSFYNGKASLATADAVTVTGGGTTPNTNAALVLGGKISGTVTATSGGLPLQSVIVSLYSSNTGEEYDYDMSDYTDAAGAYEFTGLAAGTYYLRFSKTDYLTVFYNGKSTLATANGIPVTLEATTTINVALTLGGKITGTVTAASGGAPLQSTEVCAYTSRSDSMYDCYDYDYTDASGVYTISGLPAGTYYLRFSHTDYFDSYYNGKSSLATADGVSVTLGGTSTINAALVMGGKISGTVTAANGGVPLEDVTVYAFTSRTAELYDYTAYDYTDAAGKYTLSGLETGTYYIRFAATDYLPSYYNGKSSLAEADGVSATINTETINIDASLALGGKITGTVTAAAGGALLNNVGVYAYTSQSADDYDYYDYTDASGVYTISGLPAGTYYLKFEATDFLSSYYNGRESLAEADSVSVTLGGTTGNIDAALVVGGRISGTVTAEGTGTPLEDVYVVAYTPTVTCYITEWTAVASDTTDVNGDYTISGLQTGPYKVKFEPEEYGVSAAYLGEYYNNKNSLALADQFGVTAGQTTGNINAALTKGGTITGNVTAADGGAALKDVWVDVYNSSSGYWVEDDITDVSGNYTVTGLPAGSYKVEFDPSTSGVSAAYITEYYNDKATYGAADPVSVSLGATVNNINAVLAHGGQFTGTVTAADGGALLEGVYVKVYDSQGNQKAYDYTDSSGVYTTNGLASGSYRLLFSHSYSNSVDYLAEYYNDKSTLSSADAVALTAPGKTTVNAVLARGGSISGTVTSSLNGAPLEDVDVWALDAAGNDVEWTSTDSLGKYVLRGLPSGTYHVLFAYSYCAITWSIYYHQKPTLATADQVIVTAPGAVTGIDGQLPIPATIDYRQCFLPLVKR